MADQRLRLSPEVRQLLTLVAGAAFSNPFGQERRELDHRIAGVGTSVSGARLLAAVKQRLADALAQLAPDGRPSIKSYDQDDARLVKVAALFHHFHRYETELDELIEAQAAAGDAPVVVPFHAALWSDLTALGLGEDEAARFVGIFYQLRRAFRFIGTTLAGTGPAMVALRRHLWHNVFTFHPTWYERYLYRRMEDFSTLLLGETGTGKSQVAAAIGRSSFIPYDPAKRRFKDSFTAAFVAINLAQYPATLIESELFGHKKGAFTGAVDHHAGVFGRVSPHGVLFIDEIGDIDLPTQVKLLRVLQERTFSPVGSHERQRFAGRVIGATNRDLDALREGGAFRDDFYYRLCSDVIVVPPLRERLAEAPGELDVLLGAVLRGLLGAEAEAPESLVPMVRDFLDQSVPPGYSWPGNVRELEQCIRRILLTGAYRGDQRLHREARAAPLVGGPGFRSAQQMLTDYCRQLHAQLGTYEDVARVAGLDRRTVRKYIVG